MLNKVVAVAITAGFYNCAAPFQFESKERLDLDKDLYSLCRRNFREDVKNVTAGFPGIWRAPPQRRLSFPLPPRPQFPFDLSSWKCWTSGQNPPPLFDFLAKYHLKCSIVKQKKKELGRRRKALNEG